MAILAFHNISKSFSIGVNNYKPNKLKELCDHLKGMNYVFVSLEDYLKNSGDNRLISLTFDDGLKSFLKNAYPILNSMNIPSTLFIPTYYIGKKNSWDYSSWVSPEEHLMADDVKKLSRAGVEIGSHGHSHISLAHLSDRYLKIELEKSKKILEDVTAKPVKYISYPFGRFNGNVEAMAFDAGYHRGLSLAMSPGSNAGFTLPRPAVYCWDTNYSIRAKIGGGVLSGLERIKEKTMNYYAGGTILLSKIMGKNIPQSG